MKKTALWLFMVSSLLIGMSTLSSADLNNSDYLSSWCTETENEITLNWSRPTEDGYFPVRFDKKYKLYISPALSDEDFWGNKEVDYKYVATVDSEDTNALDDWTADYDHTFENIDNTKYYRFKIEAYYGKKLLCTHYCTNVKKSEKDPDGDTFYPEMKIDGDNAVVSWDKHLYNDASLKIYRSDALTSGKYSFSDVSYKEIGSVPYADGKFTITGLKKGKDHYYGFAVCMGDGAVFKTYREFGTMPEAATVGYVNYNNYHFDKNYIELPFYAEKKSTGANMVPDGLIVYRKDKNGKYKRIGTSKPNVNYIDKDVKAGKSYTYKARTYKKINGKKYYSEYSDEVTMSAENYEGKFKLTCNKNDRSILKIESKDKYNGVICDWEDTFFAKPLNYEYIKIKKYSLDGKKWKKTDGPDIPALKPGKTIWIKLSSEPDPDAELGVNVYYGNGIRAVRWYALRYYAEDKSTYVYLYTDHEVNPLR